MSSPQSLWESFIIMIILLTIAVIINLGLAMPIEETNKNMIDSGIRDVSESWQSSSLIDFFISAMYWLVYVIDFIAVGQFVWTAVKRQKYDVYGNPIED